MASNQKDAIVKEVTIVVRSLINSLKPPVSLQRIQRDYEQVEETPIPFRSLGYRSVLDLLEDTNAFNIQKTSTDIFISVRNNSKSGHIASLVRSQKSTSRAGKTIFSRPQAPPVRHNVRPIVASNNYNNNNNNNSNNCRFKNTNNNQTHIAQEDHRAGLERLRLELGQQLLQLQKQQKESQQQELILQNNHLQLREQLLRQQQKTDWQIRQLKDQHELDLDLQADVIKKLEEDRRNLQQQLKELQQKQEQKHCQQPEQSKVTEQVQERTKKLVTEAATSKILTPPHSPPEMNGNASASAAAASAAAPAPGAPGVIISRKLNLRPILGNSASQQQAPPMMMKPQQHPTDAMAANVKRQTHSRVQFTGGARGGGTGGSSVNYRLKQQQQQQQPLPTEETKPTAAAAAQTKTATSPNAPEKQVATVKSISSAPIAPRTVSPLMQNVQPVRQSVQLKLGNDEFIDELYNELIKHNGIVVHKLPQWYEMEVKRQVPSNWMQLILNSPKIRIENGIVHQIVFANTPNMPTTTTELSLSSLTLNSANSAIPELQLPWMDGQQDWSMYITHCDNTTHVWARLIEQSAQFEKLTEQLNLHMSQLMNRQPLHEQHQPIEQKIYLVEVSENWNRVRVMSLDAEKRQCCCHFVDFGDEVIFSYDILHLCPAQFLALPAQAVCLSMYALDKFEEHPHALPVLNKEVAGHSVVTRIITSESQFRAAGGLAQGMLLPAGEEKMRRRRACIVGTFYDTSTAEDIHLNDLVADKIIRQTPAPMLKLEQKPNHVLVSHVNDMGDLMVQLPNDDLKFVQRCMAKIMSDGSEQQRVCYSDLLHDRLICVCDESGDGVKQWYRGMLVNKPKTPEEEVFDVYYVDDGRLRKTHISNIYRLEANNLALASFPAQALRVRLHDVPPINSQMLERLRGVLSPQSPVLLKVIEGITDKLPMVNILARGTDGLYVCLNIAIRTEYEMQGTSRLDPFDDGGLHFSASGHLIRRISISSSVSSQSTNSDPSTTVGSTHSLPSSPSKSKLNGLLLPMLKEYEAIPALGAYFEVRVALSVNPSHFAVQPYKCYNQLQRLMKDLQAHCNDTTAAQRVESNQLSIGQAYAAADTDGIYHRVSIRKIYDEMIHVRYVDVGDDAVVRCNELIQLKAEFRELPMMALPAQLHGIVHANIVWTKENCLRFRQLTLGQKFIGLVRRVDKLQDGRRALSLELIDTSTPQDIKLHETLITEKHALPAP